MVAGEKVREGSHLNGRNPWLIQSVAGLGVLVTSLDTGGINISLYTLAQYFRVDAATVAWLPLAAFLTVTSSLLLFGRLSDMAGRRLVFAGGFCVYGAASLLGGLSPDFSFLVAARILQAVGLSMLAANTVAILTEHIALHRRGMALGINSSVAGLGLLVGPIGAGFIIKALSWQYVFFAAVPLCIVGSAMTVLVLPSNTTNSGRQFDVLGALLFAIANVSLLLAVNNVRSAPLISPLVLGLAGAGGLAIVVFLLVERQVKVPMLDLGLFRIRLFSFSLLSGFLLFLGTSGQDVLAPLFIQQILQFDPATAGLAVSVVPLGRVLFASPSGYLSDRFGPRWLAALGCVIVAVGLLGLAQMGASATLMWVVVFLLLVGLGCGLFFSPNTHATMSAVPVERLGMAGGAIGVRRNLGQSVGVALAAYLLQAGSGADGAVAGFQLGFMAQGIALTLAAVSSLAAGSLVIARASAPAGRAVD